MNPAMTTGNRMMRILLSTEGTAWERSVIGISAELIGRGGADLVEQQADVRARAQQADCGFQLLLLGVIGFDDENGLADEAGEDRRVARRQDRGRVEHDEAVVVAPRHLVEDRAGATA